MSIKKRSYTALFFANLAGFASCRKTGVHGYSLVGLDFKILPSRPPEFEYREKL